MTAASMAPALTHAPRSMPRPAAPRGIEAPQHMRALARANEVRLARAELKRAIASGRARAADVVLDCPWETRSMTIGELLGAQRRWGHARSRKLLSLVELKENKTMGSLTDRQRRVLADELRAKEAGLQ